MLFCVVLCEKNITFAAVNLLLSLFIVHRNIITNRDGNDL